MGVSLIKRLKSSGQNLAVIDRSGKIIFTNIHGLAGNIFEVLSSEAEEEVKSVIHGNSPTGRTASRLVEGFTEVAAEPLEGAGAVVYFHRDSAVFQAERRHTLLEQMSEGFFSLDADYRFTYINEKGARELDLASAAISGKKLWDVFPALAESDYARYYIRALEQRLQVTFEEYYPPLSAWFQVNLYPQLDGGMSVFFYNLNAAKRTERRLWESEHLDSLTNLLNRKATYDHLQTLAAADEPFSLFHLNINKFQLINDVYGYETGDKIITELAARLNSILPESYVFGRFGGDEFVIAAVESMDDDRMTAYASQLLEQVDQPFASFKDDSIELRASIGVAKFPRDKKTADEMLKAADTAMYQAKKIHGDGPAIVMFQESLQQDMQRRMMIDRDLAAAIHNGSFFTVYHPQICTDTGSIIGVEVLSRWNHPKLGLIPPPEFISTIESLGKSLFFTLAVMKAGLNDYSKWVEQSDYNGRISFNVPPSIIDSSGFFKEVCRLKDIYQIADGIIELELTETANVTSSSEKRNALAALRDAGFRISIDDFGTGFSSLDYLIDFPIDEIKIDKAFVEQINANKKGCVILQKMIDLGNDLNLQVIAEGVENEDELRYLQLAGCRFIQGFLFDRPMPSDRFVLRLKKVRAQKNTGI
ncbi:diguanylate cyclase (GGDEF) domain-containing protein [Salisediminibacterium halotolerans]|uniref:Diguanylate cyclase (GGDEF) domain-containing protein n=1 Tax=Salisediminibacterium halotolerans TaxID=517425 RepID=A0A1H9RFB2_9BACI|nr:diguanylate cyclase (GGDEF) domain-containing protein [Salisediminibacterium haloalkalitolerans]